jgi:hypothetical protein
VANQTGNGASVVRFGGDDYLDLTSTITPTSNADGFTAFAFVRPRAPDYYRTIVAGTTGGFSYKISDTNAQLTDRSFEEATLNA